MNKTTYFDLNKPELSDSAAIGKLNENMDIIDEEIHKTPLTVNNTSPDPVNRDIQITTVPLAENLASDEYQNNTGTFVIRSSGGEASIANGIAWMTTVKGNIVKTGFVQEVLNMTVNSTDDENPISATIDHDTFVAYVTVSGTITLSYTDSWSSDPSLYGITVTGTPVDGDSIVVVYVKGNRGTISVTSPTSFVSTGWNLYNNVTGYARVVKYSDNYGFMISGAYTSIAFADTPAGSQISLSPVDGYFMLPPGKTSGYIIVNGGNETDTAIWMTWSDWIEEANGGVFEPYSQTMIDLSGIMVNFPYGLMKAGNIYDEIDLNAGKAYSRIERLAYNAENLETVINSGVTYDTDTNFIYAELLNPEIYNIELSGEYTVNDHGIEYFVGTSIGATAEFLYPNDLKGKLRRDVVTISQQTLSEQQQEQVRENIGAAGASELEQKINVNAPLFFVKQYKTINTVSVNSNAEKALTYGNFGITPIDGYTPIAYVSFSGKAGILLRRADPISNSAESGTTIIAVRNVTGSTISGFNPAISILYVKSELVTTPPEVQS